LFLGLCVEHVFCATHFIVESFLSPQVQKATSMSAVWLNRNKDSLKSCDNGRFIMPGLCWTLPLIWRLYVIHDVSGPDSAILVILIILTASIVIKIMTNLSV